MQGNWLVAFKGRNHSGPYQQNFLWQHDAIYIMDNHRAALWCWLQHLKKNSTYHFFHIDRHYDTLNSQIDGWIAVLPDLWTISLQDYLARSYDPPGFGLGDPEVPVIRYDNYLSLFLKLHGNLIKELRFATHGDGDEPGIGLNVSMWDMPGNMEYWLSTEATFDKHQWILNLDLDYFFCDYHHDSKVLMLSDDYIGIVFEAIAKRYKTGRIAVLTVCLSPEYCGGWQQAEELCSRFCKIMGLDFHLP